MTNDAKWIAARISEVQESHTDVPEAVSTRLTQLLNRQLTQRQLTQTDLTKAARELIADMIPPKAKAQAEQ